MRLCSACLLGVKCRYDGRTKPHPKVLKLGENETLIPVCPEQLGGLPTPREQSERKGAKVITKSGKDVTRHFKKGAEEVLKIALVIGAREAILKQRSAACASGQIYNGYFRGELIKGDGVLTELLRSKGIKVISEDEIG